MSDKHEHHHHSLPNSENINRAFYIGIALNALFTLIEFIVGYATNSLALLADASHNLSDVASLLIALIGMKLAQKAATYTYTYGYKKASILASLINSVLLIFIVVNIFIEAFGRLSAPPGVSGKAIIITAFIGVVINTISAFLFFKDQKKDINVRGAFLHLLVDALVSVGVVISGLIIYFTQWSIIDPIISFIIVAFILISTWNLLKESLKLTLDGVPKDIDFKKIEKLLAKNPNIQRVHHLHIWALSSSLNALTVHVSLKKDTNSEGFIQIKNAIKEQLRHENIQHATIELDDVETFGKAADC